MKQEITRLNLLETFYSAPEDSLFSQKTLSAVLDCSEASLERNRWSGEGLPYLKIGRSIRYRKADILTYIDQHNAKKSTSEFAIE